MNELFDMPQVGNVCWIGLRPEKRADPIVVDAVEADRDAGLIGDYFAGGTEAKRQVTLIQQEHISAVASILGCESVAPELMRRNIVVSGINLQALKEQSFSIGGAIFHATGNCPPCSQMERNLGQGGFNAMRGHGGITAYVVQSGTIRLGDAVQLTTVESRLASASRDSE